MCCVSILIFLDANALRQTIAEGLLWVLVGVYTGYWMGRTAPSLMNKKEGSDATNSTPVKKP